MAESFEDRAESIAAEMHERATCYRLTDRQRAALKDILARPGANIFCPQRPECEFMLRVNSDGVSVKQAWFGLWCDGGPQWLFREIEAIFGAGVTAHNAGNAVAVVPMTQPAASNIAAEMAKG